MTYIKMDILTNINLDDLVSSFGWENNLIPASILRLVFAQSARKFALQMVDFDNLVAHWGLGEASRQVMQKNYVCDVRVHGQEHIPNGPVLFLSNHPGMSDTLSLFATINRLDLKIIAGHRPFLASLVNTTKHLFFIDEDPTERIRAVRQVSSHLRRGGSVLTFPAGEIEPDPDVYPGALDSLNNWTDSAGVFLRFAQDTKIVPVLVTGVIWKKAAQHWIPRIKRTPLEREKLAAALQLLALIVRNARPNIIHVRFAKPVTLKEVGSTDARAIHQVVIQRMKDLFQSPKGEGVSVLYPNTTSPKNLSNNPTLETV